MGLVSFLTRRNAADRPAESVTSGHPACNTSAASSPVRGVRGTGLASSDQLQRAAARKRSQPQFSSPVKPYFLGIRDDDDRPSTAPGDDRDDPDDPDDSRPRGFQLPAASLRRADPDARSVAARSVAAYRTADAPPLPGHANHYVDLLDAHREIKPYDFKSRIRAAGTRDYGEDVAERNMKPDAAQLPSPPWEPGHKFSRSVVTMPAFAEPAEQPPMGDHKRNVFDSKTLLALTQPAPERTPSGRARRRRADAGGSNPRAPRDPTARGLVSTERRSPSGCAARSRSSSPSASPPPVPRYRQRNIQPSLVSKPDRSRSTGTGSDCRARTPSAAPRKGVRGRQNSIEAISLHPNISYAAARRQDLRGAPDPEAALAAESSDGGHLTDAAPAPRIKSSGRRQDASRGRTRTRQGEQPQWNSPWGHAGVTELPIALALSRNDSWRSASSHSRAFAEFTGYVPDRKSSLKQWSISSVAATTETSDHSSNPAARSRSAHTVNTSPYVTALEDGVSSDTTAASPASDKGQLAGTSKAVDVGACGYGSTDDSDDSDDSFAEKRRQAQDDESLLFTHGGFGDLGDNLPGLSDSAAQPPCLICSMLRGVGVKTSLTVAGPGSSWGARAACTHKAVTTRRDRLRALGYEYDTDDSASGSEGVARGRTLTQPTVGTRYRVAASRADDEHEPKAAPKMPGQATSSRSRMRGRARSRRIEPVVEDYEDGHSADVE